MAGERDGNVKAKALRCDNCGAPWEMRGFMHTRTVACESCGSVFDNTGEEWQLVQKVTAAHQLKPRYSLGTRGTLDGVEWEVIGWVERSVTSWGTRFAWEEHLLFNPYEGFRYLVFSDGHWIVVSNLPGVPSTGMNQAKFGDATYKHFSTAEATVDEVLGEFPWEIRRDDVATATDFVAPPQILSADESRGEINWTSGRYLTRDEVVAAFGAPTRPFGPLQGIHPCQPNPNAAMTRWMKRAFAAGMLMWLALSVIYFGTRQNKVIWTGQVPPEGLTVQDVEIDSFINTTTVEVEARAPQLNNAWTVVNVVLIDPSTEKATHMWAELGYWSGAGWTDGSRKKTQVFSGVKNGKYLLQIMPDPKAKYKGPAHVKITRDVPLLRYSCCTFFILLIVPLLVFGQSRAFERGRWAESDHPF